MDTDAILPLVTFVLTDIATILPGLTLLLMASGASTATVITIASALLLLLAAISASSMPFGSLLFGLIFSGPFWVIVPLLAVGLLVIVSVLRVLFSLTFRASNAAC
jgi:hypothetical protein